MAHGDPGGHAGGILARRGVHLDLTGTVGPLNELVVAGTIDHSDVGSLVDLTKKRCDLL